MGYKTMTISWRTIGILISGFVFSHHFNFSTIEGMSFAFGLGMASIEPEYKYRIWLKDK